MFRKVKDAIITSCNDEIILYDTKNGNESRLKVPEPVLPANLTKDQINSLKGEARSITSLESSNLGEYIVVATENKQVIIYNQSLSLIKQFTINRAASKVLFTHSNEILIADKTGDVYLYQFDKEDQPQLLLGHRSMILDLIISECGKYIISCDRDEKIRVSCFPNSYNIVSFCLGHKEFVTKIKLIGNILLSTSGDGTIRFWNFMEGKQLSIINTNNFIEGDTLKVFAEAMDKEKVDVIALPVSDMQINCKENVVFIAVSLYNYNAIQLFRTNLKDFKFNYVGKIDVTIPFAFLLSNDLYVFSTNLLIFQLGDEKFTQINDNNIEKFYDKYKHMLNLEKDNSVVVLYKRKFDNVKEYLERKKQRLQIK